MSENYHGSFLALWNSFIKNLSHFHERINLIYMQQHIRIYLLFAMLMEEKYTNEIVFKLCSSREQASKQYIIQIQGSAAVGYGRIN